MFVPGPLFQDIIHLSKGVGGLLAFSFINLVFYTSKSYCIIWQFNFFPWKYQYWVNIIRSASKYFLLQDEFHEGEVAVSNEMANRMSLFYAQATPMLKTLSDITSHFVSQVRKCSTACWREDFCFKYNNISCQLLVCFLIVLAILFSFVFNFDFICYVFAIRKRFFCV